MAHCYFFPGIPCTVDHFHTVFWYGIRNNTQVFHITCMYDSLGVVNTQGRSDFEQAQSNIILVAVIAPHIVELIKLSITAELRIQYYTENLAFMVCSKWFTIRAYSIFHNSLKDVLWWLCVNCVMFESALSVCANKVFVKSLIPKMNTHSKCYIIPTRIEICIYAFNVYACYSTRSKFKFKAVAKSFAMLKKTRLENSHYKLTYKSVP